MSKETFLDDFFVLGGSTDMLIVLWSADKSHKERRGSQKLTNYMDTNFNNNIQYIHSHMEKPAVSSDFFIALDGEKNHSGKKKDMN